MKYTLIIILSLLVSSLNAQELAASPSVFLEKYEDFSYGVFQGYWLVIGGRLVADDSVDVLSSFNTSLRVFDWKKDTIVNLLVTNFPVAIKEQLTSAGMSFFQEGNKLYLVGGYGYRSSDEACATIPSLMVLDIPEIIKAILDECNPIAYFKQTQEPRFALRNSQLLRWGDSFLLVGGEKAYVVAGKKDDRLFFVEDCKDKVQRFKVKIVNEKLEVSFYKNWQNFQKISETFLLFH